MRCGTYGLKLEMLGATGMRFRHAVPRISMTISTTTTLVQRIRSPPVWTTILVLQWCLDAAMGMSMAQRIAIRVSGSTGAVDVLFFGLIISCGIRLPSCRPVLQRNIMSIHGWMSVRQLRALLQQWCAGECCRESSLPRVHR